MSDREFQCEHDKSITGKDLRAFADYCVDVSASLGKYGLTPERTVEIARHIESECYLCAEEVAIYMGCTGLAEEMELACIPEEGLSFENESMEDLYRACRARQDRKRIAEKKVEYGRSVTDSVADAIVVQMVENHVPATEANFTNIKLDILKVLGQYLGCVQKCPGTEALGRYKYGPINPEDLDRVNSHLEECDLCAHALDELDKAEAAKPKQTQKKDQARTD
jgi:hypothetical protein